MEWLEGNEAPTDYWLGNLGEGNIGLKRLFKTARARWRAELDYRELKEELGLDHYEGRHWLGWHHHVTLVSMAFAFLRCEQSRIKKSLPATLPEVRRRLQAALIRLCGRCPWRQTRFNSF